MSQLPPADQSPQATTPVYEPAFETAVQTFWVKNRQGILVMCVTALLAIIGTYAWQAVAAGRESDVQAEYAKIADQPAKLEGFAGANAGHPLAGVAWLRLADEKFSAGDFKTAAADYQKAAGSLKNEALLGRAKLGAAVSQLNGGDVAGGSAALKAVSADTTLGKGARAEAAYQLVSLAADAGKTDEVKKLAEEVSKIDATSSWAQRATLLVISPAIAAKPGDAKPADTGLSFKTPGK
ncbi:tetratricopeptide repeat protein [Opitutus sp. GAS368]|jgi:predicted negative regulator of RcsB-dependent stress response|uniref:tetratricopeptide repeat protein n=1 Tax=Opitutus sp. GAS368 TaxID=1882749 RepID=UPI00087B18BA|nr:tetratricopeptide repeat protein [Opitutus sp. GAS368]SDR87345.1 Tetratricopeptide repeat-containing protein [Opitutus sp. GAS368]